MKDMSSFELIGNIGKIDVREKVTYIDIASNLYFKDKAGTWQEDTHWNRVTFFGQPKSQADNLEIGQRIQIKGRVRQTSYLVNGERQYGTELKAFEIALADQG